MKRANRSYVPAWYPPIRGRTRAAPRRTVFTPCRILIPETNGMTLHGHETPREWTRRRAIHNPRILPRGHVRTARSGDGKMADPLRSLTAKKTTISGIACLHTIPTTVAFSRRMLHQIVQGGVRPRAGVFPGPDAEKRWRNGRSEVGIAPPSGHIPRGTRCVERAKRDTAYPMFLTTCGAETRIRPSDSKDIRHATIGTTAIAETCRVIARIIQDATRVAKIGRVCVAMPRDGMGTEGNADRTRGLERVGTTAVRTVMLAIGTTTVRLETAVSGTTAERAATVNGTSEVGNATGISNRIATSASAISIRCDSKGESRKIARYATSSTPTAPRERPLRVVPDLPPKRVVHRIPRVATRVAPMGVRRASNDAAKPTGPTKTLG